MLFVYPTFKLFLIFIHLPPHVRDIPLHGLVGQLAEPILVIQMFPKEVQQTDIDAEMHVYTFFKAL